MIHLRSFIFVLAFICPLVPFSQTVVINEVSNGPSGNKEWVELLVIATVPTPCAPQVMDLRGWILDDNNGYFAPGAGTGISTGCNRFSLDPFWSAIPVGTIISIYNNTDANAYFTPAVLDQSLTDGNCSLVLSITNSLFENHATLPSLIDASYPTTGWLAGGVWDRLALNDADDSFQLRNPSSIATPSFSVSYGNNNANTLIYFAGTGAAMRYAATQATSCDWRLQSNWQQGAASSSETPNQNNSSTNATCRNNQAQTCGSTSGGLQITASADTVICAGSSATISVSGANSYFWDNGLGAGNSHVVSPVASTWYHVTGTTGSCTATDSAYVEIYASNSIQLMPDGDICEPTLAMTANSSISPGVWSFTCSTMGTATFQNPNSINQMVTFSGLGVYILIFTESKCGQKDSIVITYDDQLALKFEPTDFLKCVNALEIIVVMDSIKYQSISWGNVALNNKYRVELDAGVYTVSAVGVNGCVIDSTFTIDNFKPVQLEDNILLCETSYTYLFNQGPPTGQWSTIFNGSTVVYSSATVLNPIVYFNTPGNYELVYYSAECQQKDTSHLQVVFTPYVEVANEQICDGETTEFKAFTGFNNIDKYTWSTGSNATSIKVAEPGTYYLLATNVCGTDSTSFTLSLINCEISMPNVFTPNGDNKNDLYTAIIADPSLFQQYSCQIFNRWGQEIFTSQTVDKGWSGKDKSDKELNDGVYFYVVSAKNISGKTFDLKGLFHLVRN